MEKQLNFLIQLQQLDRMIAQTLINSQDNPRKMERIDEEIQMVQETLQTFLSELDEVKKQRRVLDREVEELDLKIKKSQLKLMEVKTNKEYRAMLTEIEELKKGKTGKEDLLLELLEKLEEGARKENSLKKGVESEVAEGIVKKKELEKEALSLEGRLSELEQERKALVSLLDSALLKQYEFLKERLRGVAVAEVKDAACLGCHMHLPPQLYNELHRQDKIIVCPSCLRILYLSQPAGKKEEI